MGCEKLLTQKNTGPIDEIFLRHSPNKLELGRRKEEQQMVDCSFYIVSFASSHSNEINQPVLSYRTKRAFLKSTKHLREWPGHSVGQISL